MTFNNKMTRFRRSALALTLMVGTLTALGCNGNCEKPRSIGTPQLPTAKQSSAATGSNQLVVYLDASKSMKGYVAGERGGETTFSRTLQELRNFITLVNPPLDVLVRRVGAKVGAPLNNTVLSQASMNKGIFEDNETNLAGALDLFPQSLNTGGEPNTLPPRFHVLITDGVQSSNKELLDLSCTVGADQACVRKKIFDLMNAGWGGCIIAMRSEFNGDIFSEVNRAARRPSALHYQSVDDDAQSMRPFYLYVLSPDRDAVEPFVATLLDRLKSLVGEHPESLRVLPLSFQYANAATKAETTARQDSAKGLTVRQSERSDIPEFTVEVDLDTAQTGAQPFSIKVTIPWSRTVLSGTSHSELAQILQWELKPNYPDQPGSNMRYPEVKYISSRLDNSGQTILQLTAQWVPNQVGETCWRGYRLEGRLKPENQTPEWILEWSTNMDTTIENGNRTLYLESSLLGLWRNPFLNNQLIAEAVFLAGAP